MRAKNIIQKFKHILNKYVEQLDIKNSRNIGRPNKFNNFFYIKHILNYLFTGISWSNIELFIDDLSGDAIRKKFNKWASLGVFTEAYNDFIQLYSKCKGVKLNELFMDATILKNTCCSKKITGFCKKLPKKRSSKATFICDENKIGLAVTIHSSSPHDSQHIEEVINNIPNAVSDTFTYNRPCIITADKGYIINKNRKNDIRRNQHASLNYHGRSNMKKVHKTTRNKELLKKRIKVEHLNSRILRSFKALSTMKYENEQRRNVLFKLAFTIQMFEYMFEKNIPINL